MSPERWEQIKGQVKDNFKVEEEDKIHEEERGGVDIELIVFQGPLGRMKLEFTSKPVVIDKKTIYSNRIGAETKVDYVYSDTDKRHNLKAYKWNEEGENWMEIDAGSFE